MEETKKRKINDKELISFINEDIKLIIHLNKANCRLLIEKDKSKTWNDIYNFASLVAVEAAFLYKKEKSSFRYFWNMRFKSKINDELIKVFTEKRRKENIVYYKNNCYSVLNDGSGVKELIKDVNKKNILTEYENKILNLYLTYHLSGFKKNRDRSSKKILKKLNTTNINFNSVTRTARKKIRRVFCLDDYIDSNDSFDYIKLNTNEAQ